MGALVQFDLLESTVKAKIEEMSLPKGIHLKSVFSDTDYSGDPAIYIIFSVSKQMGLGPARIRLLGDLRNRVFEIVDALQTDRFAYVRFMDVK